MEPCCFSAERQPVFMAKIVSFLRVLAMRSKNKGISSSPLLALSSRATSSLAPFVKVHRMKAPLLLQLGSVGVSNLMDKDGGQRKQSSVARNGCQ